MEMKFYNKMLMGLEGMWMNSKKLGGMPSSILIQMAEGFQILKEVNSFRTKQKDYRMHQFGFRKLDTNALMLVVAKELSDGEINELLIDWKTGKFTVQFNEIPLLIVG